MQTLTPREVATLLEAKGWVVNPPLGTEAPTRSFTLGAWTSTGHVDSFDTPLAALWLYPESQAGWSVARRTLNAAGYSVTDAYAHYQTKVLLVSTEPWPWYEEIDGVRYPQLVSQAALDTLRR